MRPARVVLLVVRASGRFVIAGALAASIAACSVLAGLGEYGGAPDSPDGAMPGSDASQEGTPLDAPPDKVPADSGCPVTFCEDFAEPGPPFAFDTVQGSSASVRQDPTIVYAGEDASAAFETMANTSVFLQKVFPIKSAAPPKTAHIEFAFRVDAIAGTGNDVVLVELTGIDAQRAQGPTNRIFFSTAVSKAGFDICDFTTDAGCTRVMVEPPLLLEEWYAATVDVGLDPTANGTISMQIDARGAAMTNGATTVTFVAGYRLNAGVIVGETQDVVHLDRIRLSLQQ